MLHDGLADFCCLAVEVVYPASRESDTRVGIRFAACPLLTLFGGFVDGKLIFKSQQDHSNRGNHLAEDDGSSETGVEIGIA